MGAPSLPGASFAPTAGGAQSLDFGASASSSAGDVYSTTNTTQGGLTVNQRQNPWVMVAGIVVIGVLGGVYLWRQ